RTSGTGCSRVTIATSTRSARPRSSRSCWPPDRPPRPPRPTYTPGMKRRARAPRRKAGGAAAARVVILAAGLGSRRRSARPTVLRGVAGRTLREAVLASADGLVPERVVVVIGKGRESVAASLEGRDVTFAVQDPPLGTGDAARRGLEALGAGEGPVVVLSGD